MGLSYLLFICLKISFNVLFKHLFRETLEIFIGIKIREYLFIGHASKCYTFSFIRILNAILIL